MTDQPAVALPFYDKVIGLTSAEVPMGPDYSYTMFSVGDRQVGGSTTPQMEGVPNHWNVWFATADVDATVAAATGLGGSALVVPMDMPVGRMAQPSATRRARVAQPGVLDLSGKRIEAQ